MKETLTEGLENLAVSPFLVNIDTGAVSLNFDPQKGMKGYFDFKVGVTPHLSLCVGTDNSKPDFRLRI